MSESLFPPRIRVVDSHTEGEPTRVVVDGWPQPEGATMEERREDLRRHHDHLRGAVIGEPRGFDAVVGALLTPPVTAGAAAGVIFFNNVGYLGMCGHGLIGVARTLVHLGRAGSGRIMVDTPVGPVDALVGDDGRITIRNVPARCHALDVTVDVPGLGRVTGDVAWGGNWFFITRVPQLRLEPARLAELTAAAKAIRAALDAAGITGSDGATIDHVEFTAPSPSPSETDARNFVLCPGGEYDRSPCGTGTSAKLAVLHARGVLAPGRVWRQESVTGGRFDAWLEETESGLAPRVRGRAFITAEAVLHLDPEDPLRAGIRRT
jgi:4-hydroxyproline epimerase